MMYCDVMTRHDNIKATRCNITKCDAMYNMMYNSMM